MNKLIDYVNTHYSFSDEYFRLFNKRLPTGKCFCVFHDNKNTPSAKLYIDNNGNEVFHCFSEQRSYRVYDLLKVYDPSKLEQIKQSIIVPESSLTLPKVSYTIKVLDRTKPIDQLITDILS